MEMTEKKTEKFQGHEYEMGVGFSEVRKGDVIKVYPGRVEVITSVNVLRNWDGVAIHTQSGETYYTYLSDSSKLILDYGKRIS